MSLSGILEGAGAYKARRAFGHGVVQDRLGVLVRYTRTQNTKAGKGRNRGGGHLSQLKIMCRFSVEFLYHPALCIEYTYVIDVFSTQVSSLATQALVLSIITQYKA